MRRDPNAAAAAFEADLALAGEGAAGQTDSPWRRATRSLLRKRIAVVALALIFIIYGAGAYTLLDAFGLPTGLQDPQAINLSVQRPVQSVGGDVETLGVFLERLNAELELSVTIDDLIANNGFDRDQVQLAADGVEPLGQFADRHGLGLATLADLNPSLNDRYGPFTDSTEMPELTILVIPGPSRLYAPLTPSTVLPAGTLLLLKPEESLEGPSGDHLFGTDLDGRDLFSRTLFAARTTLIITIISFAFGNILLGLSLGLLAGYRGGWVDAIIMRVGDVFLAIPALLVLIVANASLRDRWTEWIGSIDDFLGTSFLIDQGVDDFSLLVFVFSLLGWVGTTRFIRAQVLALREEDFIMAAESIGAGTPRILFRHLLPAVSPWIIVGISAGLGAIAGAEVALTWLGLGVQPPTASFGSMITAAGGARTFREFPHLLLVPGVTVAILILSFNLLGDAINDVVSPKGG